MKFRTGLIVGLATGYVLGAKAGRQRYDQIMRLVGRITDGSGVNDVVAQAAQAARPTGGRVRTAVSDGLRAAGNSIRSDRPGE